MEATTKIKKSVLIRQQKEAAKALVGGASVAKLQNCPTSPRKMRLVVDLIRGEGRKVIAGCGFVVDYLYKHPEYADLMA